MERCRLGEPVSKQVPCSPPFGLRFILSALNTGESMRFIAARRAGKTAAEAKRENAKTAAFAAEDSADTIYSWKWTKTAEL
jgi:hypothetical protein